MLSMAWNRWCTHGFADVTKISGKELLRKWGRFWRIHLSLDMSSPTWRPPKNGISGAPCPPTDSHRSMIFSALKLQQRAAGKLGKKLHDSYSAIQNVRKHQKMTAKTKLKMHSHCHLYILTPHLLCIFGVLSKPRLAIGFWDIHFLHWKPNEKIHPELSWRTSERSNFKSSSSISMSRFPSYLKPAKQPWSVVNVKTFRPSFQVTPCNKRDAPNFEFVKNSLDFLAIPSQYFDVSAHCTIRPRASWTTFTCRETPVNLSKIWYVWFRGCWRKWVLPCFRTSDPIDVTHACIWFYIWI